MLVLWRRRSFRTGMQEEIERRSGKRGQTGTNATSGRDGKTAGGKRTMVELEGRCSTSEEIKKTPLDIKVCGGTLKVAGFVENVPCQFVVDTGADVTILSSRVFHRLKSNGLIKTAAAEGVVRGLDGKIIPVTGRVRIASIQEECILGADVLKNGGCVIDYPR